MGRIMTEYEKVELDIIHDELRHVGVSVPVKVLALWKIESRARVEQWAIRKRWATLVRPPYPSDHCWQPGPIPAVVKKWMQSPTERPN